MSADLEGLRWFSPSQSRRWHLFHIRGDDRGKSLCGRWLAFVLDDSASPARENDTEQVGNLPGDDCSECWRKRRAIEGKE